MADGVPSRGFGDLDPSVLAGPPRDGHHALPFPYLIDSPRSRLPLVKSIRVFSACIQVDGFGKAIIEDSVQQTVGCDAASLERHVRQEFENLISALNRDFFHRHNLYIVA